MATLTNEEKIGIIDQHIKNVEYNKFNLEISLVEENSVGSDTTVISSLNAQIDALETKLAALQAEKANLTV